MAEDTRKHCCEIDDSRVQLHVHEFEGSTKITQKYGEAHNHRFAGISSEPIPEGRSHVHEVLTDTDFYEDHNHSVGGRSGLAIDVGGGKHIHFAKSITSLKDGHIHDFEFAAQIDNPIDGRKKRNDDE